MYFFICRSIEMAERNGLSLHSSIPIISIEWDGYDFKRHQSGKSFRRKIDDCKHYCFVRSNESTVMNMNENLFQTLHRLFVLPIIQDPVLTTDANILNVKKKKLKTGKFHSSLFNSID